MIQYRTTRCRVFYVYVMPNIFFLWLFMRLVESFPLNFNSFSSETKAGYTIVACGCSEAVVWLGNSALRIFQPTYSRSKLSQRVALQATENKDRQFFLNKSSPTQDQLMHIQSCCYMSRISVNDIGSLSQCSFALFMERDS